MSHIGWKQLVDGWPWYQGDGGYPILPNSEFMPPVRLGVKPYGTRDALPLTEDDPWGWPISEYEEQLSILSGLRRIGGEVIHKLASLCAGKTEDIQVNEFKLKKNVYWPRELAEHADTLKHERFVLLLPLALSITQDDKGRTPWTLFGNSEQGPARAFWRSFFTTPDHEVPAEDAFDFFRKLLSSAYEEPMRGLKDLHAAGLRILPLGDDSPYSEGPLPSWTAPLLLGDREPLDSVKYLLTFRPFGELSKRVRTRYLNGELHLLPFPGSLIFWGIPAYQKLREKLPFALQIPLMHFVERHLGIDAIATPQAGWFKEEGPDLRARHHRHFNGAHRPTYRRTHRTARVHRHTDELTTADEHHMAHVLFSTRPHDIDLYHKPMARNIELWDHDFNLILDGPHATPTDILRAAERVQRGGVFGYRFLFPAARIGRHMIYWHRPLVAHIHPKSGKCAVLCESLLGYLTAYPAEPLDLAHPVELWPRLLRREPHLANVAALKKLKDTPPRRTLTDVRNVLHAADLWQGSPLPRSIARQLLADSKEKSLESWLRSLPRKSGKADIGKELVRQIGLRISSVKEEDEPLPKPLTYAATATRKFEEDYWNEIARMSSPSEYPNKNNADCVLDHPTQSVLRHHHRDLDNLGDYILNYYTKLIADKGDVPGVLVGELPFRWNTQYQFPWMGGWVKNQGEAFAERNLIMVIPGRNRRQAVIMSDHYDTAYMYDHYEKQYGGNGARLAAPGADDNCSATAALMLGAHPFLELSRQGKLDCDIWLIHLTGEEYPAEGLGACRLCEWLVQRNLKMRTREGQWHDLSQVEVRGLYVLDMIAHNANSGRNIFQMAPGVSRESLWLAYQSHQATRLWNASTEKWNKSASRQKAAQGKRSRDGKTIPPLARFPQLHGEVRLSFDPRSTLFNTDGQAFSDVGVPVVLFMENYDINRVGYHDSHDNMTLINLDYGAALAAITIESVARAATEEPPAWYGGR
jgi:Peptidase family M28